MIRVSRLVLLSLGLLSPAYGDDELFSLSLAQLAQLEVAVSSRRSEPQSTAPGVITVLTASELSAFGARNLHDVMRLIPGVQPIYPQLTHRNAIAMRGLSSGANDKYFLVLLNGIPMRDPILHGVNAPIYEGVPLHRIERIEIIRGPGSVIYGSNAFAGVMNIILKKAESTSATLRAQAGSFDTEILEASASAVIEQDLTLSLSLRSNYSGGWDLDHVDTAGNYGSFRNRNSTDSVLLEAAYKNLSFTYFDSDLVERATISNGLIADVTDRPTDRTLYALAYKTDINQQWQMRGSISSNHSDVASLTRYDASDTVVELSAHGTLAIGSVDIGVNTRRNKLVDASDTKVSDIRYSSIFSQWQSGLGERHVLTAGLQVVDPDTSDIQYAPRIALATRLTDQWESKIVYGRAYSSPTGLEFSLAIPGLFFGDENLKPTTVDNFDIALQYQQQSLFTSVNAFYAKIKKPIGLVDITPGVPLPKKFANLDDEELWGIEFEGRYDWSENLHMTGSYSFHSSKDSNGKNNNKFLSQHLAKLGLTYQVNNRFQLGLFNAYYSKPGNREPLVNRFNPDEKPYSHLTFNARYRFAPMFSNRAKLSAAFFIDNALESSNVFLPDPTLSNLNTQPKVAERSYYLTLQLNY